MSRNSRNLSDRTEHRVDGLPALVRMAVALATLAGANPRAKATVAILDSHRQVQRSMIILLHPQSTKPKTGASPWPSFRSPRCWKGKKSLHRGR